MSWLDLMKRAGYISAETEARLLALCEEILRLISARMIELDKRTGTTRALHDHREEYVVE